jgi:autotransporter-associated beta strand protein
MSYKSLICSAATLFSVWTPASLKAEFLFTSNGDFIVPALDYQNSLTRYSEWRSFYSTSTAGNLPDYYADFGGINVGGSWFPTPRPENNPNFPYQPTYTSDRPNAFWDVSNPTITQTNTTTGHITAGGRFYGITGGQSFRLDDNTMATSDAGSIPGYDAGIVVFQFQTDGEFVDLSKVRLVYMDGGVEKYIYANDPQLAEYLREYKTPESANSDPSSAQGFRNRTAIQWDLTGLGISDYHIEWDTEAHTSFQQASLDTSDTYTDSIPTSRTWTGGSGNWSNGSEWLKRAGGDSIGSTPVANGNVKFQNTEAATVSLSTNHTAGELIFDSPFDVTIDNPDNSTLTVNTGISTTENAIGTYTIRNNYELGALNLFSINAGSVVLEGVVSGNYGILKEGSGSLTLANNNSFSGFIDIRGGTVRLLGTNSFSGFTNIYYGSLVVAADGALANTSAITIGASELFEGIADNQASLVLEGARTVDKNIAFGVGAFEEAIVAQNTGGGEALVSGTVTLSSGLNDVRFRALNAGDILNFSGQITAGGLSRAVTMDGEGTVVYSGVAKTYNNATVVSNGTLLLETIYSGAGNFTVKNGGRLEVGTAGNLQQGLLPSATVTIENGGVLAGEGTVGRRVVTSGINSVIENGATGSLSLAALNASAGVTFRVDLTSPEAITIVGSFQVGNVQFEFLGENAEAGIVYTLIAYGSVTGLNLENFSVLNKGYVLDEAFGTGGWYVDEVGKTIQVQFAAVPEPSTYILIMLALAGMVFSYRFARKS